jgi:hypothetical protein
MECIGFIQCAQPVLRVNFMMLLVLRGRYGLRVRSCIRAFELSAGFALALLPVMCTAIPLLLAQDRSKPFSAATLAAIARVEAEIDRIEADALGGG